MTRVSKNIYLNAREELLASYVASIARLTNRKSFHRMIGWYRRIKSPLAFHRLNIKTIRRMGQQLHFKSLQSMADEFEKIVDEAEKEALQSDK